MALLRVFLSGLWSYPTSASHTQRKFKSHVPSACPPGTSYASPRRYINSNGLFELFHGYSNTLNSLVYQAVDKSNTINRLQLVLLVIEGCCICAIVVAYMAWLLKKVRQQ